MKKNILEIYNHNSAILGRLNPPNLWRHMMPYCMTPRGSHNESAMAQAIVNLAIENNLQVERDAHNNVLVRVPATAGFEHYPYTCLQSHLDMVCEKDKKIKDMFPIKLILGRDYMLRADGTTLGGDDATGGMPMMEIMCNRTIKHGPLELLFTTAEEVDMSGAENFDYKKLKSKRILNLDSEEEGYVYVGSAGGGQMDGTLQIIFCNSGDKNLKYQIDISKLRGGHSGTDIHKGHANALKMLTQILSQMNEIEFGLASFSGGNFPNAITPSAQATIMVSEKDAKKIDQVFKKVIKGIRTENPGEKKLKITLKSIPGQKQERIFQSVSQKNLLQLIQKLPQGVICMEPGDDTLVRTSNNIGIVKMNDKGKLVITTMYRSSDNAEIDRMKKEIRVIFKENGARTRAYGSMDPWQPQFNTALLREIVSTYNEFWGDLKVRTIHAGLECAVFSKRIRGVEIVSIGPEMGKVHTTEEWLDIASFERFWNFLLVFLQKDFSK